MTDFLVREHTVDETVRQLAHALFGPDLPVQIRTPDGTTIGPPDAKACIVLRSEDALKYVVRAPGELGVARAFVSGALDIEGDIWHVMDLQRRLPDVRLDLGDLARSLRLIGPSAILSPPAIPDEEVISRRPGRRHSRSSDAASISHHYDVSNDFYRLILGPSWTYSCAVFESGDDTLEQAQHNKYELISRKLDLQPGMRLLDVGCGWGGMVIHAARHHGVEAVGITISQEQAAMAKQRVDEAGLSDRIDIRVQDYRDVEDGSFDAISSIGMFEHVGAAQLREYFSILYGLLPPEGRLLNHQIGRPATVGTRPRVRRERRRVHPRGFIHRYVFPNGELHEIGDLVSNIQRTGLEVRHVESLREHYALTLRHWSNNLEANWDDAVAMVGEGRARVWRLYMAASSSLFASNGVQVHQVLASKTADGQSGVPLRPTWTGSLGN